MFDWLNDPQVWIGLLTLTILEIVLGIDNIIFISIVSGKLPVEKRDSARNLGLTLALVTRVLLLLSIGWVMSLKATVLALPYFNIDLSWRDLILAVGGLFLIAKAVHEIHGKLEGGEHGHKDSAKKVSFGSVIFQILILDLIFSLDSVITAVGMVDQVAIMIAAVVIAIIFMLWFAKPVSLFVEKHPTVKILALAFLILIGVNLVAEGFHQHIEKGYTYFAMAFATVVELINLKFRKGQAIHLNEPSLEE